MEPVDSDVVDELWLDSLLMGAFNDEEQDFTDQQPLANNNGPATTPESAICWGAQLKTLLPGGVETQPCDGAFVPGKNHLKNRFCASCKQGLLVPSSHIRTLTPELAPEFSNGRGSGFWTYGAVNGVACEYRVVNQTRGCRGAPLVIFALPPPASLGIAWGELPTEWLSSERPDLVPLAFALGTLEPLRSITQAYGAHRRNIPMHKQRRRQRRQAAQPGLPFPQDDAGQARAPLKVSGTRGQSVVIQSGRTDRVYYFYRQTDTFPVMGEWVTVCVDPTA